MRDNAAHHIAHAVMVQLERLERLYRLVEKEIALYESEMLAWTEADASARKEMSRPRIDSQALRLAVMLFERQARLMGMDKQPEKGDRTTGWLSDAPINRVLEFAKQLRVAEPSMFETPEPVTAD